MVFLGFLTVVNVTMIGFVPAYKAGNPFICTCLTQAISDLTKFTAEFNRMKHFLIILLVLFSLSAANAQIPPGRNISIRLTPLKNTKVYLGSNYGGTQALFDSAFLNDKSEGAFRGSTKLTGGIYFVVTNVRGYEIQFDFLMDDIQQFSITADTAFKDKAVIAGSPENTMYDSWKKFAVVQGKYSQALDSSFKTIKIKTKADTTSYNKKYKKINEDLAHYRDSISEKYPNSLLGNLFNTLKRPIVPEIPIVKGKPDSLYPYHFVKGHYWDDVNFSDDRMLHTPFFEAKVDEYFKYYISIEADSIIKEVNYMLLAARAGKEIYPYLLTKFTKQYMNPQYMGQDKVFVFLFENFYLKGDTTLLDASNKQIISDRAYKLMANQIGLLAAPMDFPDTAGRITPLYSIKAPFTVLAFWDPTCGHCKIEIPRLDSMYRAKWKALGVTIYAVNVNEPEFKAWKKFIAENKLTGWVHTHESDAVRTATEKAHQMNFRQAYDVFKTPTFYLLDKDKHIIAKQLSMEQFDELIKIKLKNSKP
jgi:thiol-disulfide isomerase/thioredoxin